MVVVVSREPRRRGRGGRAVAAHLGLQPRARARVHLHVPAHCLRAAVALVHRNIVLLNLKPFFVATQLGFSTRPLARVHLHIPAHCLRAAVVLVH